ncbi:MAG: bifunctional [glutamine synthetase] adenylyltransferase/[glutamine synthetase]-adenylyl-L-tyrosine phosphorylase [Pseudomonadota bacterium]
MTRFVGEDTTLPRVHDLERGVAALAALDGPLAEGAGAALIEGAAGSSPFLARLIAREGAWLSDQADRTPERILDDLRRSTIEAVEGADRAAVMRALRGLRSRSALVIALADLGGAFPLAATTGALTALATTALDIAISHLLPNARLPHRLPADEQEAEGHGYAVIGMGKLGAGELNYSSDIDLICLFNQDAYPPSDEGEARAAFIRMTRAIVDMLSAQTAEGYVFRTDLRLRPRPSSLPVCLSMAAAERYYEAEGRTWERAAHVKAAASAGDRAAGAAYLARLAPFVWRHSLDFYALEEVQGLLGQIRAKAGAHATPAPDAVPGTDIKRAPGGIREIELFVQTRQLILGGRNPALRSPTTLGALDALAGAGEIPVEAARQLAEDYVAHRMLEHRMQMVEDAQTHTMPTAETARARLAALCGLADASALERDVAARLERVHRLAQETLGPPRPVRRPRLNSADQSALAEAGFAQPDDAARLLGRWRSGHVAATRSSRARTLYETLEPRLISGLSGAASPDDALNAFERFIDGLPAGVQVFSLLSANPGLMTVLIDVMAASPPLAQHLGRNPAALEALIARDFFDRPPGRDTATAGLEGELAGIDDLERALDRARVWMHESHFRISVQVLRGRLDASDAGRAYSAVADACLAGLAPRVAGDMARRYGLPPGRGMVVLALGKLGTQEMTSGSDLDLITVYDAGAAEQSEGQKPLAPAAYYPRLTKALVSALTAPTAEGRLYEVDMRLRPSGRSGPVAVSLASFRRYNAEEAAVWEHMALSRARVVAVLPGDMGHDAATALAADVRAVIAKAMAARASTPAETMAEAAAMRARLIEAHGTERGRPWILKYAAGGVMEIEFLAQAGGLVTHQPAPLPASALLLRLARDGWLATEDADLLSEALALMQMLQQVERAALDRPTGRDAFGPCLESAMCRATGAADFDVLEDRLRRLQADAARIAEARLPLPADGATDTAAPDV